MAGVSTIVSVALQRHHSNAADGCPLEVYGHYDIQIFYHTYNDGIKYSQRQLQVVHAQYLSISSQHQ